MLGFNLRTELRIAWIPENGSGVRTPLPENELLGHSHKNKCLREGLYLEVVHMV